MDSRLAIEMEPVAVVAAAAAVLKTPRVGTDWQPAEVAVEDAVELAVAVDRRYLPAPDTRVDSFGSHLAVVADSYHSESILGRYWSLADNYHHPFDVRTLDDFCTPHQLPADRAWYTSGIPSSVDHPSVRSLHFRSA